MRRPLVITAVVGVVLGAALFQVIAHDPATPADSRNTPPSILGPESQTAPTPTRRPSPVDAASSAIRSSGDLVRAGFITRSDLIRRLASERFGPMLDKSSAAQLAQMTAALGAAGVAAETVVWEELPLTSHLVAGTSDSARVEVWSLLIIGVPGHGAPRQLWRTVTIDLVWEREAWRIDGWESTPGPTPAMTTTEPISDLSAIEQVLAWDAATRGAG